MTIASGTIAPPKHGSDTVTDGIRVIVRPAFVPSQSSVERRQYLFSYSVMIRNEGLSRVRLATRRWRERG